MILNLNFDTDINSVEDVHRDDMPPLNALVECVDLYNSGAWAVENAVYNLEEVMQHLNRLVNG